MSNNTIISNNVEFGDMYSGPPANIWDVIINSYFGIMHTMTKFTDPKVKHFPLTNWPFPTAFICLLYLYLVNYLLPNIMKNRKAFDLRKLLMVYNFSMVIANLWLHYEFWMAGWGTGYNFLCENVDYDINPKSMRMANLMWWYYISKIVDLFDTIFIVLRKQGHKITFLHFFHHFSMPGNAWVLLRFLPGGHCTFHGLLNSFVHMVMYFYYGISALYGSENRKHLWWKKYVTLSQLIQFYLDCFHLALPFYFDCGFPKVILAYMLSQASVFLVLFTDFYIRTYITKQQEKPVQNGHLD